MSFQTYTRPRRAAVSPAAVGPVTKAIRGLRPNEMPSWEMREQEMRRQEAADLLALRRRVAKAVAEGIDFLDATGGDCDLEEDAGDMGEADDRYGNLDDEPSLCGTTAANVHFATERDSVSDGEMDAGDDREEENEHAEHDGREPDEDEPSLGSTHDESQSRWGASDTQGREAGDDNGIADQAGENWLRGKLAGEFA